MSLVYILAGSNLGDRKKNLSAAIFLAGKIFGRIICSSSVYETEPWGYKSSNSYLNQCFCVSTGLDPETVLRETLSIEKQTGRIRGIESGYLDRLLDLDILLYDRLVLHTDKLTIPHPRMHERRFALVPLYEMDPGLYHPVLKKTVSELLQLCTDPLRVKILSSGV